LSPSDHLCEVIACPVCGSGDFNPLFEKAGESFVRCARCSLMLINPPPAPADTAATYDERYSDGYIRKADKKLKRCRGWVRRLQRRFVAAGRWLDVGCSAGFVVRAASDAGFEAYGVELEPAAVRYGREQLGLATLRCGTLEAQAYATGSFDVISLYDVIEHVPDLNQLVDELHRLLSSSGVVEIRTPNVAHWRNPRDLSTWKEVKPSEHLYYFDAATLTRLFQAHGFVLAHKRLMLKPALDMFFHKRPAA
jgi:2-polyprenyl-3-methyl-5-hydroxy-6-metoxy-1,4-benzoquinol methylase